PCRLRARPRRRSTYPWDAPSSFLLDGRPTRRAVRQDYASRWNAISTIATQPASGRPRFLTTSTTLPTGPASALPLPKIGATWTSYFRSILTWRNFMRAVFALVG